MIDPLQVSIIGIIFSIVIHLKSTIEQRSEYKCSLQKMSLIKDMIGKITLVIIASILFLCVKSDTAIVTYHLYTKYDKLTTVSCSDGANGLMSWGYKDLSLMFPYVTAWQASPWNSPQCGSCVKIMWKGKYTYVTVIDQCGVINSAYSHFDMSKEAFLGLFGQEGYAKGTMTANFTIVPSKYCPGNRKGPLSSITPVAFDIEENEEKSEKQQPSGYQNPLWIKRENDIRPNLGTESVQQSFSSPSSQSSGQTATNPLWTKGSSGVGVSLPQTQRTEYGGFSYDRQNERQQGSSDRV